MVLAHEVEKKFNQLSRSLDDNFIDYHQLKDFKEFLVKESIKIYDECPESVDGTLLCVLSDGSAFELQNPNQHSFAAQGGGYAGWYVTKSFCQIK